MGIKRIALLAIGALLVLLGSLWFLQGAGIVRMQPVLCFANCEPVTGPQSLWVMIGFGTVAAGAILIALGARSRISS